MVVTDDLQDIGRMAATSALAVIGVDGTAGDRRHRLLEMARLVERIGMDKGLDIVLVSDTQAAIDHRWRDSHVLMHFQAARPTGDGVFDVRWRAAAATPEEADIQRKRFE